MSLSNATDPEFRYHNNPAIQHDGVYPSSRGPKPPVDGNEPPLPAPLDALIGTWHGEGFNTIWRPHFPDNPQDRFLELNLTSETLTFTPIKGAIPNRGLLQQDINLFGATYHQQIAERADPTQGLHNEPGIWIAIPQTSAPLVGPTVARLASIPHGTTILAQGTVVTVDGGPIIQPNDIIPFGLNGGQPLKGTFAQAEEIFPELNLVIPTQFRSEDPGIDQEMVENPNVVLTRAIANQDITNTTVLIVATNDLPVPGGGTSNTAFLQGGGSNATQANANATLVTAIFWIETVLDGDDVFQQLQYTQTVMLDFNGLRWPHVTVATLRK